MCAEINQVLVERVWERLAMSISELGLYNGVDFKKTRNLDDKYDVPAEYQTYIQKHSLTRHTQVTSILNDKLAGSTNRHAGN